MNNLHAESQKKSGSVLEKLGQKITNIKEDIADNIERRRLSHCSTSSSQSHSSNRTNLTDELLVNEKRQPPLTPPSSHLRRPSGKNRKENSHISIKRKRKGYMVHALFSSFS